MDELRAPTPPRIAGGRLRSPTWEINYDEKDNSRDMRRGTHHRDKNNHNNHYGHDDRWMRKDDRYRRSRSRSRHSDRRRPLSTERDSPVQDYRKRRHDDRWRKDDRTRVERDDRTNRSDGNDQSDRRRRSRSRSRERRRSRSLDRESNRKDDRWRRSNYGGRTPSTDKRVNGEEDEQHRQGTYNATKPEKGIVIKHAPLGVTPQELHTIVAASGVNPKNVSMSKFNPGSSKRTAFVEFSSLSDSMRWMEMNKGEFSIRGQHAYLSYEIPAADDWYCSKCEQHNFSRRSECFKCRSPRTNSDDETTWVTKTILLKNLDTLTVESDILAELKSRIPQHIAKITAVKVPKDKLTHTSRNICYLSLETTADSLEVRQSLDQLDPPLTIAGKDVVVSYARSETDNPAPAPAYNQMGLMYTMNDVNGLANFSAARSSTDPATFQHYYNYYVNYYSQLIQQGVPIQLSQVSQADEANAAAAVAQAAMLKKTSEQIADKKITTVPNGTDRIKYPTPNVATYVYEPTTGFYYDSVTGLYYDPNSTYYYNSSTQKYLYWDASQQTYILCPNQTTESSTAPPEETSTKKEKIKKPEPMDKQKAAQKLAKDMERWARSVNKAKAKSAVERADAPVHGVKGAADVCYSVIEKKASDLKKMPTPSSSSDLNALVSYETSDNSGGEDNITITEGIDWDNLICTLCKRKFTTKDLLTKHQQVSDLHKTNLAQYKLEHSIQNNEPVKYRDRAKERRKKFGLDKEAPTSKLKQTYLQTREIIEPTTIAQAKPIGSDNVGSKLMEKMGWSAGQGLGRTNQGRVDIIEAGGNVSTSGLGSNSYQALPGDSYKDIVKKMTYVRYKELSDD